MNEPTYYLYLVMVGIVFGKDKEVVDSLEVRIMIVIVINIVVDFEDNAVQNIKGIVEKKGKDGEFVVGNISRNLDKSIIVVGTDKKGCL